MSEYSKALLSEEAEYPCQNVKANERVVALAVLSAFVDAVISAVLLSLWLPFSLPLWPLFGAIFLSTFYAFRRSNPIALRPLLILLMFALALCPTLFVALVLFSVHDPFRAVCFLNVFLPFVPSHSSPFAVLLPFCFVLFCSILYFYWQLHSFWHCQKHFEETKRWDNSKMKGYAELYVADPFLSCVSAEKQRLEQKHRRKGKEANESVDETKPPIQARVTLCEVLPDYQVFSLDEEEPKAKRRAEEEGQQQKQKETNSQIRGSG